MARIKRGYVKTSLGHMLVRFGGTGDPVLVLHHTYGSSESGMRGNFLPRLADSYFVVAPDTVGQGQSEPGTEQLDVGNYAEQVRELMDALGIQRAQFVGHHTGASISLEFAARYPDRAAKLLFSGLPVWSAEQREQRQAGAKYQPWEPREDGGHLAELWKARSVIAHGLTPLEAHWQFVEYLRAGPRVSEPLQALFRYDALAAMERVRCPVLAATALSDPFGKELDAICQRVAACEQAIVADGTLFHNLDADAFLSTVLNFLD
jgi:pimeloyl-ACP methyl ester carboxylesterase